MPDARSVDNPSVTARKPALRPAEACAAVVVKAPAVTAPGITSAVRDGADGAVRASGRDLRLDFFRGLALILIFIDHIPGNILNYLTLQSFQFFDAAEIFIF